LINAQQLQNLTQETGTLVYKPVDAGLNIEVRQKGDIRWLHQDGPAIQAAMSLTNPHSLMLPYTRAMLLVLCLSQNPKKALNLGLGGGMFVRFFETMLPSLKLESVDNQTEMLAIMRQYFPSETPAIVHIIDARDFVSQQASTYDFILCDLFNGSTMPECLFEPAFFRDCAQRLGNRGVIAVNILAVDADTLTNLLINLRQSLPCVAIMELADFQNIILFASAKPLPEMNEIRTRAEVLSRQFEIDFNSLVNTLTLLPAKI
jgi:spermidine synthase